MPFSPFGALVFTFAPRTPCSMAAAIRFMAASISLSEDARFLIGTYVRSISTETRGISRRNRLIAVPPLSAKAGSAATSGTILINRATCLRYASASGIDRLRDCDLELRVQLPALHEHALSSPEVDILAIQLLLPRVLVPLGKPQEEAFHLHTAAGYQESTQPPRAEIAHSLH